MIAGWLPRVNEPALTQFLTPVRDYLATQGWPVLATLSDKQGVLVNALKHIWPGALQHWCHSHYLRNAVDPLYDRDQAFKTDLRRDVRRVIRRSMSEVAAQARSGAYAPQMVTGLVLTEAPSAPNVPLSTKADTEATVSALPDTPTAHPVIQGYAQVLQHTLARDGRAPWFLAGLTLYADLQAIAESMARCLAKRPDPRLQLWHAALAANLERHAPDFDTIRRGQTWVEAIRRVLDEIPLPTPDAPGPGGDAAARNLAFALGRIADESVTDPWLIEFRQHLLALSERYWPGLFPCYDIVGLPRTNNDLEGLYGQTKRNARRLSGLRKSASLSNVTGLGWSIAAKTNPRPRYTLAWPSPARQVRAQVLSLKERAFVQIARLSGMSGLEIIFRELMPHMLQWLGANFVNAFIAAILAESGLSILGLGPQRQMTIGMMIYWALS